MITDDELRISNLSYTNKDFVSIYPELLDLAKSISPKWNPTQTNESDPGLVLLKLLAFIGDKTNYNSDKNVLECFLPSATQDKSVRALCEMGGYFPKYYRSAETRVSFRYDGKKIDNEGYRFQFNAFDTQVTDEDGEVTYTLLENITFFESKKVYSALAIQGTFKDLEGAGSNGEVQLSDLDDSNRVYLPESMVAENGVFVFDDFTEGTTKYTSSWERVNNLNIVAPSTEKEGRVYKVGYDSEEGLPYVEFPSNIASLIGSGLIVKYCVTSGANGNVSAGALVKLKSPVDFSVAGNNNAATGVTLNFSEAGDSPSSVSSDDESASDYSDLVVKNVASTVNGSDPDGVDEAYNGFKKTIGTFDTLVTCRDYANAIYNMEDESTGDPLVSNAVVTDRRTDVNYSTRVVTFSELGKSTKVLTQDMSAYDLCLYPMSPMAPSYTADNYSESFKPLTDTVEIEAALEGSKSVSHDYYDISHAETWAIKNYYGINAVIATSSKVGTFEQAEIKSAVAKALMKAFNGRQVDYGYEIPFDSILKTIEEADGRIKSVSLAEPELRSVVMDAGGAETSVLQEDNGIRKTYLTMLAKNILAGKVRLFEYDDDFDVDFGMSNVSGGSEHKAANIYKIETSVTIPSASYKDGYILKENEVVQLIAQNLSTKITYPAYTNYRYEPGDAGAKKIDKNTEHVLKGTEKLLINYTDSNGVVHDITYSGGGITDSSGADMEYVTGDPVIVKASIDIEPITSENGSTVQKNTIPYYSLSTSDTIEDRRKASRKIDDAQLFCYWSTASAGNALFTEDNRETDGNTTWYERLLGDNEYFAYTDSSKTELVILQSGTRLRYESSSLGNDGDWTCDKALLSNITSGGMSVFEDFNWKVKAFNQHNLCVDDMQILTLAEKDKIKITGLNNDITSKWQSLPYGAAVEYKLFDESTTESLPMPTDGSSSLGWKVRSRLDLNCGPSKMQKLHARQSITFHCNEDWKEGEEADEESKLVPTSEKQVKIAGSDSDDAPYIMTNIAYNGVSGGDVNTIVANISSDGTKYSLDLKALYFAYAEATYSKSNNESSKLEWKDSYASIPLSSLNYEDQNTAKVNLPVLSDNAEHLLLMTYISGDADGVSSSQVTITSNDTSGSPYEFIRELHVDSPDYGSSVVISPDSASGTSSMICVIEAKGVIDDTKQLGSLVIKVNGKPSGALNLILGKPMMVPTESSGEAALNESFNLLGYEPSFLMKTVKELDSSGIFYYNLPESQSMMDADDLSNPSALWDRNNVYNRVTIGEIDFGKGAFNVSVAKSSRK